MPSEPLPPGEESAAEPFGATVDVEQHGAAVILRVAGELDMLTTPKLQEAAVKALGEQPEVLVMDLSEVTFLASAAMSAIVSTHQDGGDTTKVRVVADNREILRPIMVTGLDNVLAIYPDLASALQA